MSFDPAQRCVCVAGPTAVGKSAVAIQLALGLGGEILTADSMQVYRGMDIGTAKPSPSDQKLVPHHLLDLVEVREAFDAAQYAERAKQCMDQVLRRGRVPILCGGTGLYLQALFHGLGEAPASDPELRAQLEATPLAMLLEELREKDPATHARVDHRNFRRVVRAVEVLRMAGRSIFDLRAPWAPAGPAANANERDVVIYRCFVLSRPQPDLRGRIDKRVDQMFAQGLVEETRLLLSRGLEENRNAMQAIGYRQVLDHLRGERDLPATVELVKQKTRHYAKRQRTWFRYQIQAEWMEIPDGEPAEQTASRIQERLRQATTNALNIT